MKPLLLQNTGGKQCQRASALNFDLYFYMRNRFILFASRSLVGFASALVWLVLGAAMMDVCQAQTGPGSALAFDGTGYVEVDSMPNLPLNNQLTLEAWVRPANSGCMTIASRGVGDFNSDYIFALSYDGVSACGNASLNLFCAGAWHISSTNVVPANVWTHVAVTFDGTTKKFYINGMLNATRPYSGVINQTGTPFFVGRQGCNCSYSYFTGQI